MNKIFKLTNCIAVLLLLVLSSCLKQNLGDYKPDSVNDLSINNNLKDAYIANVGDILKLDARVDQSKGNETLTYQWSYYSIKDNAGEKIIVGNAAQLDLKIDMVTGPYFLVLETTDTKTGVKGFKKISLTVKRFTSEGWLLLTWKDNKTNLSIVSSENDVLKGFLQPSNDYPLNFKPQKLICVNDWDSNSQPIVITTAQPNLYFLNHETFEILGDGAGVFPAGANLNLAHYGTDIYNNAFYTWDDDGLVYDVSRKSPIDFPTGFDQPLTGNYKAGKNMIAVSSMFPIQTVFYDELHKRFMYQKMGEKEMLAFGTKTPNAAFDMNNFTDEVKFAGNGAADISYVVGKNSTGDYRLYTMALNEALDVYPALAVDVLNFKDNGKPALFTLSGKLPVLYYIANNALYVYKINEKLSTLLYTFPAGESAVAISMLSGSPWFTAKDHPGVENRIGVAMNAGSEGIFYTFELGSTGDLKPGNNRNRIGGFDPIVDIAYKMTK